MKKILSFWFIFILFCINSFSDEFNFDNFGITLEVGIKRLENSTVYIKAEQGDMICEYKNGSNLKQDIIKQGEIITLKYSNNKIKYRNKLFNQINLYKKDVITIFSLSKNKNTYSKYRGEFKFLSIEGKILPINLIRAEEYLYSVVPSEIGFSFPDEAIKAQAVAARSYLYYSLKNKKFNHYDLEDSVSSQVYLGYDKESDRITELVNKTENEVMLYNNSPINALFHSTSGGRTANSEDVWGTYIPYLRSVKDTGNGNKSPRQNWNYTISKNNLSKKIGFKVKYIKIIEKKDDRIKKLQLVGNSRKTVTGDTFRSIIGYNKVFSTMFQVKSDQNNFYFKGHGSGHGVGMPQWSAYGLAKKGKKYKEILKYFYKNITISKIKIN